MNQETRKTPYNDVFFLNTMQESVVWMYYNPDSHSGGQYVINRLSYDQIREAGNNTGNSEQFFEMLEEKARQYLVDCDTEEFKDVAEDYRTPADYYGCTEKTRKGLAERVGIIIEKKSILDRLKETGKEPKKGNMKTEVSL